MANRQTWRQPVQIAVMASPVGMAWSLCVKVGIFNMRGFYTDLGYIEPTRAKSNKNIPRHLWRTLKSKGMIERAHLARQRLKEMNIAPEVDPITGRYKPLWYELSTIKTNIPRPI